MSIVHGGGEACPSLIGPGELSRWRAVFRFADKQLERNGEVRPMQLTVTRHPGINLLEGGKKEAEELKKLWHTKAEEQRSVLTTAPQKYAFLTGNGREEEEEEEEEEVESEETEEEEEVSDSDRRESTVEDWMKR